QYQEVKDLMDIITEQPVKHFLSEEEKQTIQEWDKKLIDCRNLVAACGKAYVNEGLNKVLRDMQKHPGHPKLPGVGVFLCRMLRWLDPWGEQLPAFEPPPPPPPAAPVVAAAEPPSPPVLTSIEIYPHSALVAPHGVQQYRAIAKDQYGHALS